MVSTTRGNHLVADLTGVGNIELISTSAFVKAALVGAKINGGIVFALYSNGFTADAQFPAEGVETVNANGITPRNVNHLNPITFTDSRINGGLATDAWLQVNAFNTSATNQTLALTRLIYDDASTTLP